MLALCLALLILSTSPDAGPAPVLVPACSGEAKLHGSKREEFRETVDRLAKSTYFQALVAASGAPKSCRLKVDGSTTHVDFAFSDGSTFRDDAGSGEVAFESEFAHFANPITRKAAEALLTKAALKVEDTCKLDWAHPEKLPDAKGGETAFRYNCSEINLVVALKLDGKSLVGQVERHFAD